MIDRAERIRQAIKSKGLSYAELEKVTGVSKSALQRYASGETKKIPVDVVENIAAATGVTARFLMGWDEETPQKDELENLMLQHDNIKPVKLRRFPLLGEIACGKPVFADEERESYVMADMDIRADFCLRAKGDSMIGARIYDGDIVFIREMPIVENGEIAAVIIDDEATLKRVYYYPSQGKLVLTPENPAYEPLVYVGDELNQIRILGKAVYFMSAL
ncbi:MAG: helix-turn-helix domain-containing protein [Oscillospiraceae bacterium]|nr:helix-turn-helix domain-containing protein [Oscillospiraceae bacterium]